MLGTIDRLRGGHKVENDFIECKRDWPGENKARQLAGSLNRASGDPVVYIIGIDESGQVHDVSGTEVLDWWSQIVPAFDQTPPEMSRHMDVAIGPGESVVAIAISSDRAPYVVRTGNPKPSLEIPMREGTGTRTARRDELLRMMLPTVRVPPTVVLSADVSAQYIGYNGNPPTLRVNGAIRLFFEHAGTQMATLPVYGMRGRIAFGDEVFELSVRPPYNSEKSPPIPQFGVASTNEWLVVTGPGAENLGVTALDTPESSRLTIPQMETCEIELELDVLDANRPVTVRLQLIRQEKPSWDKEPTYVGKWVFRHPKVP